jgi:NTE family protein
MKALVLSGGGSKSAHSVGMLRYILGECKINYDIFCGVSAGAINCAFLAQYPTGEEEEASAKLAEMWSKIKTKDIYKRWFFWGRTASLWKSSLYDSSPLADLIRTNLDLNKIRSSGKKVNVGTVSITSGKYTIFNQSSDYFIDAVIGSASFPGLLTPIQFMGQMWSDGGIKEYSPIVKAIECGADVIDVIITSPQTRINLFLPKPNIIDIVKRSFDLSTDKITANDIEKVQTHNMLAEINLAKGHVNLNILRPDYNLIADLLDFSPEKIKEMMDRGYLDAKNKYII